MIASTTHGYERFSAILTLSTSYVKSGQPITVYAGIGSFSDASKPIFTINGIIVPIDEEGRATYKFTAGKKPGQYLIPVKIEYTKPDGVQCVKKEIVKYTVAN